MQGGRGGDLHGSGAPLIRPASRATFSRRGEKGIRGIVFENDLMIHRITSSRGWRRLALAFAAGALGALAMPPFGVLPALVLSLTLATWLMDGTAQGTLRRAVLSCALVGWAWASDTLPPGCGG